MNTVRLADPQRPREGAPAWTYVFSLRHLYADTDGTGYLGTFSVDKDHAQAFHGKQLSDVQHAVKSELWNVDAELTTVVEQDQSIVRVLFRPSSDRSRLEMIYGGGEKAVSYPHPFRNASVAAPPLLSWICFGPS